MATTKQKRAASSTATNASLTEVLKDSGDDLNTSIKDWAGFVRAVPTTISEPTKLVEQYYELREQALARRRARVLAFVGAAPKARMAVPHVSVPQVSLPQLPKPQVSMPRLRRSGGEATDTVTESD